LYRSITTRKVSLFAGAVALVIVIIFTLIPGSNAAAEEDATINVERLVGTYVGITIDFSTEINGSFAGTVNGKHFNCETIPPNKLYCIGPLAYWTGPATLHIYSQSSGEIVFSEIVAAPPKNGDSNGSPTEPEPPAPPESEECPAGECEININ
jgi:hypothetical protein